MEASLLRVPYISSPHSWGSFHELSSPTVLLFCLSPFDGSFLSPFSQILSSYQTLCWPHFCPVLSPHSSTHCLWALATPAPTPNHTGHDFPMTLSQQDISEEPAAVDRLRWASWGSSQCLPNVIYVPGIGLGPENKSKKLTVHPQAVYCLAAGF